MDTIEYIISSDLAELEAINQKINNHMISIVPNYSGIQWGTIKKHPTLKQYVLMINDDSRKPKDSLSLAEKTKFVIPEKSWEL